MSAPPVRLRDLLEHLVESRVEFVLIGGLAVNAWGYLRGTPDRLRDRDDVAALEAARG